MTTARASIPAARYRERLAAAQALAVEGGYSAILVGVGADLRYLTGYPAMPLERLTMLVIPAHGRVVTRRATARGGARPTRARRPPPATCRSSPGRSPTTRTRSWPGWSPPADPGTPAAQRKIAVSDDLPARHLLRAADRLGGARLELASTVLSALRIVKDRDEIALLRQAAHAADRVVAQIAAGRLVGRTEADVAREVRERLVAEGHDDAHFAIVGSGPELGVAPSRGVRPGHRAPASRSSSTSAARSMATARTSPGRCGSPAATRRRAPTSASATCSASCTAPRRPRRVRSGPGSRPKRSTRAARASDRGRGLRRRVLPPDRARHRARGPRGPVHHRRQPRAASRGDGLLDRARDLPRRASTAPGSRTSSCAVRTGRSRSTRRPASCTSSTAERAGRSRDTRATSSRGPRRPRTGRCPARTATRPTPGTAPRRPRPRAGPSSPVSWRFLIASRPAAGSS